MSGTDGIRSADNKSALETGDLLDSEVAGGMLLAAAELCGNIGEHVFTDESNTTPFPEHMESWWLPFPLSATDELFPEVAGGMMLAAAGVCGNVGEHVFMEESNTTLPFPLSVTADKFFLLGNTSSVG